ncbi:MAG TPA: MFS transporter [Caulobacteraceae bacterium]|nr:MFS transporter [Caulobacteraceae bacterium]
MTAPASDAAAADEAPNGPPRWRELASPALAPRAALITLGVWLNAADSLVTATIMPSVAHGLDAYAWFGWAAAGFLTGAIAAGASAGRLAERIGLRAAMAIAAMVYAAGCAASAFSPGIASFLVGRVVQGIGAGWVVGFCYVAIGQVFPQRIWPRMFGAMSGVWGAASLLGPLVGGLFAAAGIWRACFWMFGGQALVFALAALALIPARVRSDASPRAFAGATLAVLSAAIACIALAGVLEGLWTAAGLCAAGLLLMVLAIRINASPGQRLLPPEAGQPRTRAGAGYAMIFALAAAGSVIGVYGAAVLQAVHGLSPLAAGYVVCAEAMAWTLFALWVSVQPQRRHKLLIRLGPAVVVAGVAMVAASIGRADVWIIVGAAVVQGAGYGLCWSLATARILGALPDEDRGVGASAVPTTQMIGSAAGAAACGALANALGLAHGFSAAAAQTNAIWLFGASVPVAAAGLIAALRLARD